MENCINNQQLLSDNYIVQPVESIPISLIDYNKIEMTQLINSEQLANGTPVIHLADLNSNIKSKTLHPLELEIQRDFELKQQTMVKSSMSSMLDCSSQAEDQFLQKPEKVLATTSSLFDGVMQLHTLPNEKDNILNISSSESVENVLCSITPNNKQIGIEKKQFIILSDNPVLFNLTSKNMKFDQKNVSGDVINFSDTNNKCDFSDLSVMLQNNKSPKKVQKITSADTDSETDEDNIEPVNDYEPDPDSSVAVNTGHVEKPNKCYVCFRSFRQKKNMYAHIRKIHSTQPKIEGGILCPLCKMHALRQEHLRNHLESLHKIPIEREDKLFNTMEEFSSWKEFIEKETLSFYVSKSSSKLLANNQQKTYYKCHRSGNYVTLKKENRKKKLKIQGSNKIGATCPAAMEVTENVNGINVTFWKTHVGHENDLAHVVLTKEDKAKIMAFINSGISWDKILEKFRKDDSKSSMPPSKLSIVSKQDFRNIKKTQELKSNPELFATRKKNLQGRKPVKERILKRASQSLVIEKADLLLNLLETTDVRPEFRPKICLMIDNLISTIKRRAIKISKRDSSKRKQWIKCENSGIVKEFEPK